MLSVEQQVAVEATDPRILCRAAAGSGKTRVLVARVQRLLSEGIHPTEIFCVTFTRTAAAEMRERLLAALQPMVRWKARKVQVTTFHAWAASVLREYADTAGLVSNFSIRDDVDREDLIKFVGQELALKFKSAARLWQEPEVRTRYATLMREANALDFDGIEAELARLLTRHPNVAAELRRRVPHVLVDEYQDTSAGQQALLATLAPPHLFRVGDHAQSIYGFRGAHVEGFQEAAASSAIYDLSTNYRSLAEIVLAARQVGDQMSVPGLPQVSGRGPGPDSAGELTAPDRETLLDRLVSDLHQTKAELGCDWKDLAILAPRWFSLQALAQLLEGEGIPHRLAKRSTDLLDGPVARWVVHLLRVASNPHDHLSLYAALTAWAPLVSTGSWAKIRRVAMDRGGNVLDVAIAEGLPIVHALAGRSLSEADEFLRVIRDDLAEQFDRLHLGSRVEELDRVIARVVQWAFEEVEGDDSDSVSAFLDWYSGRHLDGEREVESVPDAVVLSSVHGAKGLEWRAVWVLGVEEEGSGAWVKAAASPEQEDEARRLLYVAMTRARDRLRLCWPEHRGRTRLLAGVELPVLLPPERERRAPALPVAESDLPF